MPNFKIVAIKLLPPGDGVSLFIDHAELASDIMGEANPPVGEVQKQGLFVWDPHVEKQTLEWIEGEWLVVFFNPANTDRKSFLTCDDETYQALFA